MAIPLDFSLASVLLSVLFTSLVFFNLNLYSLPLSSLLQCHLSLFCFWFFAAHLSVPCRCLLCSNVTCLYFASGFLRLTYPFPAAVFFASMSPVSILLLVFCGSLISSLPLSSLLQCHLSLFCFWFFAAHLSVPCLGQARPFVNCLCFITAAFLAG